MKPLYLASGSPRRRELLTQIGVPFTAIGAEIDETPWTTKPLRPMSSAWRAARPRRVGKPWTPAWMAACWAPIRLWYWTDEFSANPWTRPTP